MRVEAPYGDVVDRIAILLLKERHLDDGPRRENVRAELAALREAWRDEGLPPIEGLAAWEALSLVNSRLWDVEDALRDCERNTDFGAEFVRLARSVYVLNDERAALKRGINDALGSRLIEEKVYRR